MRMQEIFPHSGYEFFEDGDAAIKHADQAVMSAKRQKKSAQISKAQDNVNKRRRELSDLYKTGT